MKTKLFAFLILCIGWKSNVFAQNGEQIFKKCFTCHTLGKKSTGPDLVGVRAKWIEAGEAEMLYKWVNNSEALIASGNSSMANAIKDFSPTVMESIPLSNEEVDAVFDYIDSWTPPVAAAEQITDGTGDEVVVITPNYHRNLKFFYVLISMTLIALFAIFMVSFSIKSLVKSDYFKQRIKKGIDDTINKGLPIILGLIFMGNTFYSNAFTMNRQVGNPEELPWILIENSDLWILLGVNLLLVCLVWYLKGMFMNFVYMVRPKVEKPVKASRAKKINRILTDVVDIEDEHEILIDHEYDGIQELDNNLPPWWVWLFYITIAWAVIYLVHYHVFKTGDLQDQEYQKVMIRKQLEVDEYLKSMAMNVDETSATLMEDEADLKAGKSIFDANCVVCHLSDGSGKIGPNLTDKYWIYGYDIKELFGIIKYGTDKGMPEHASKLKPTQIQEVASYILHFKPVEGGLAPQGDIIKED